MLYFFNLLLIVLNILTVNKLNKCEKILIYTYIYN